MHNQNFIHLSFPSSSLVLLYPLYSEWYIFDIFQVMNYPRCINPEEFQLGETEQVMNYKTSIARKPLYEMKLNAER